MLHSFQFLFLFLWSQSLVQSERCYPRRVYPQNPEDWLPQNFGMDRRTIRDLKDLFQVNLGPSRTIPELIRENGYPLEIHNVTTDDGYILTQYRIPHGRDPSSNVGRKGPVLFHHGFLSYSACFIALPQETNLPYQMADRGYDVWITNARGTRQSMGHVNQTQNSTSPFDEKKFWDFSFEEMGTFDVPATIDYILDISRVETGHQKIFYVGMSMGTTVFFSGMSLRPEYTKKIRLMMALAPVAHLYNTTSLIRAQAQAEIALQAGENWFAPTKVDGPLTPQDFNLFYQRYFASFCDPQYMSREICGRIGFLISGRDFRQTNITSVPQFARYFQSTGSFKTMRHLAQLILHDNFSRFDFGPKGNPKKYGQCLPPNYDVRRIHCPVALFSTLNDELAQPSDVRKLVTKLRKLVYHKVVQLPGWNHADFLLGYDVKEEVNDPLFDLMENY